jgi:NADP-dependent 3-hydroxy acid dehydrogenase YdfG
MGLLDKKRIIVTGGSSGIGMAMIDSYLNEGALVVNWSRTAPDGIESDRFLHLSCDITSEEDVQRCAQSSIEFLGGTDVLINNAGMGIYGNVVEMSSSDWRKMFDVNVHGLFYATKAILPSMIQQSSGHVINIASIAGLNGVRGMAGYVGTKHAVRGISHSLFQEVREHGIKVSTVYPGSVQTRFFDDIPKWDAHEHMMQPEDIAKSVMELINTSPNYFPVDLEVRPLKPKG